MTLHASSFPYKLCAYKQNVFLCCTLNVVVLFFKNLFPARELDCIFVAGYIWCDSQNICWRRRDSRNEYQWQVRPFLPRLQFCPTFCARKLHDCSSLCCKVSLTAFVMQLMWTTSGQGWTEVEEWMYVLAYLVLCFIVHSASCCMISRMIQDIVLENCV